MITARLKQSPDTASAPWVPAKTKRPLAKTKSRSEKDKTPPQTFPRVKLLAEKDMTPKTPYH